MFKCYKILCAILVVRIRRVLIHIYIYLSLYRRGCKYLLMLKIILLLLTKRLNYYIIIYLYSILNYTNKLKKNFFLIKSVKKNLLNSEPFYLLKTKKGLAISVLTVYICSNYYIVLYRNRNLWYWDYLLWKVVCWYNKSRLKNIF